MLNDKDIQKLKKVLATKEDLDKFSVRAFETFSTKEDLDKFSVRAFETFATKEGLENFVTKDEFREAISGLHTAIDAYAQKVDVLAQEMIMLAHKVDRHEQWLHQIADKLGIKLEY